MHETQVEPGCGGCAHSFVTGQGVQGWHSSEARSVLALNPHLSCRESTPHPSAYACLLLRPSSCAPTDDGEALDTALRGYWSDEDSGTLATSSRPVNLAKRVEAGAWEGDMLLADCAGDAGPASARPCMPHLSPVPLRASHDGAGYGCCRHSCRPQPAIHSSCSSSSMALHTL